MKILVTVKRVVDPYAKVRPLPDGSGIDTTGLKFDINPFDEIAVEEAVRMKERDSSISVTVVSIGPPECEEQLRKALAMGADDAVLIETDQAFDSPGIAAELVEMARETMPDLILMGKQATDDDCNQAAQMLAAKLGWPQATFAAKIEPDGSKLRVTRETDTGSETLEFSLPAVVTSDLRLNEPRYIALPGIIKARSKPLRRQATRANAPPRTSLKAVEATPERAGGQRVGSVDELVSALRKKGVL